MAATWKNVTQDVLDLASELIEKYHPHLLDCNIGFLFRSEAPKNSGKVVYGKAKKVSDETNALLAEEAKLHFLIWLAEDVWEDLDAIQQAALVDHELCHCGFRDSQLAMIRHDVEEFNCILERYGFWWPGSAETAQAIQARLPMQRTGRVVAVETTQQFQDAVNEFLHEADRAT